ncbi:MAG: flagellar basal body P-ring formation protein FlgA [Thermotogota bacterium]|nr:flagellar basal body P-ring formation protein FlgA [Thermotogota bacterium]MDK2864539.1 flagellar basal body P-ring formation protein FlgA [Thermotogota bacterium]HCZ06193.1 flagella basal body P-ring formation protein FlgA [Thermotogota bacterium]
MRGFLLGLSFFLALTVFGITLKEEVYVTGQEVMLSDLTDAEIPQDILIAYAPPPGYSITLNGQSVAQRIERLLNLSVNAPETIRVFRYDSTKAKSAEVAEKQIFVEDVERALEEAVKLAVTQIRDDISATEITLNVEGEISPDPRAKRFELNLARITRSSFSVLVRYLDEKGSSLSVDYLKVFARVERPIWVASRMIYAGEILTEDDATLTEMNILELDGYVRHDIAIRGLKTTRSFKKSEPFDPAYLKLPPLATKGSVVPAVFDTGWLKVSTFVRLMEDGYAERYVVSRNVQTGELVYGILSRDGVLLVQPFIEVSSR